MEYMSNKVPYLVDVVALSAGSDTYLSSIHRADGDVGNVTQYLPPGRCPTPIGEYHL